MNDLHTGEGIKKGIPNQRNAFFKKSLTYY